MKNPIFSPASKDRKQVLILARHGNTFAPQDRPVWVGARTDLPLTEKGLAQAIAIGEALQKAHITPDVILTGPLKRTQETTRIVADMLKIEPAKIHTDARLREIDYGAWEGKSTEELIAAGEGEALAAWNAESIFPVNRGWKPVDGQIVADIHFILSERDSGTVLIVTSNGILRFFCSAAVNARDFTDRKVATGHMCVMERKGSADWSIAQWNQPPHLIHLKG